MAYSHYFSERPWDTGKRYLIGCEVRGVRVKLLSAPGVFSAKRIDKGTEVLLKYMILEDGWRILDLGCGYGVIGIVAAKLAPRGYVVLTDINRLAVKLARENLRLNKVLNAEVRQGNLYEPVKGERFNAILCNPPISAGLKVCYRIVDEAPEFLLPGGFLQLVARHNKGGSRLMERMKKVFGNCKVLGTEGGFRVYCSSLKAEKT